MGDKNRLSFAGSFEFVEIGGVEYETSMLTAL